jgi:hypothetical protein
MACHMPVATSSRDPNAWVLADRAINSLAYVNVLIDRSAFKKWTGLKSIKRPRKCRHYGSAVAPVPFNARTCQRIERLAHFSDAKVTPKSSQILPE